MMRILVVDDIPLNRKLLQVTLETEGCEVLVAADGYAALEILEREAIDGVISDVLMPNMDGLQLCSEIRRNPRFNHIPIVMHTSTHFEESERRVAYEFGADAFLEKPTPVKTIIATLLAAKEKRANGASTVPPTVPRQMEVLRQYNETLIHKLETKNSELRDSERRYRKIINNIPDVIRSSDADGNTTFMSENVEPLFGYTAAEVCQMGAGWLDRIHLADKDKVIAGYRAFFHEGKRFDAEYRIRKKDGSWMWVHDRAVASHEENGIRFADGIFSDITARKRSQMLVQLQYLLVQILSDSLSLVEAAPRVIETICESFGWAGGALWVKSSANDLTCVESWYSPDYMTEHFSELTATMSFPVGHGLPGRVWERRGPVWIEEIAHDSGYVRRAAALAAGLHGAVGIPIEIGGEMLGALDFISADPMTYDESYDEVFTAIGRQLGQFMERRNSEEQLRKAQKLEVLGQLAGGIAHDFNNILTVIRCCCDLALRSIAANHKVQRDLEQIQAAEQMAAGLTTQLLAFSRGQVTEPSVIDANDVIAGIGKMLQRLLPENIALSAKYAVSSAPVKVDPGQFEQVIVNLVVNARDAMPHGGSILVETAECSLTDSFDGRTKGLQPGRYVMVAVSDTGSGMSDEVQQHIFEPFFTTKEVGKGTGLGLATCLGIIRQAGGSIQVYSELGTGTTFKVFLPFATEAIAPVVVEAPVSVRGGNEIIVLVEDEAALRSVTARVLTESGYRVLTASNGAEGIRLVEAHLKDGIGLVMTDVVMPELGGRELAEQIRTLDPGIKILFSSGYTADAIVQQGNHRAKLRLHPEAVFDSDAHSEGEGDARFAVLGPAERRVKDA